MTGLSDCRLIDRWPIIEADLWDGDYLDPVQPASVTFSDDGYGEIAYHPGDEAVLTAQRVTSSTAC